MRLHHEELIVQEVRTWAGTQNSGQGQANVITEGV